MCGMDNINLEFFSNVADSVRNFAGAFFESDEVRRMRERVEENKKMYDFFKRTVEQEKSENEVFNENLQAMKAELEFLYEQYVEQLDALNSDHLSDKETASNKTDQTSEIADSFRELESLLRNYPGLPQDPKEIEGPSQIEAITQSRMDHHHRVRAQAEVCINQHQEQLRELKAQLQQLSTFKHF